MVRAVIWVLGATLAVSAAQMENDRLRLTIDETSGLVTVEDRAAGRSWQTLADERTTRTISVRALKDGIECALAAGDVKAIWRLDGREVCCLLTAKAKGKVPKVYYPAPFAAQKGERLLLPHGCGYAFPAEAVDLGGIAQMDEMPFYTRAMKMGCWGHFGEHVAADGTIVQDAGYLAIVETPSDANADFRVRANDCRAMNPVWLPEQGSWGYDRSIRYVFFKTATPIALAQRYRQEMKRRGYLVTYAEKIKRNPRLAEAYRQFYGAPDVWYWEIGGEKAKIVAELKRMGFENMLFQYIRRKDLGNWVTPEEVREVAKIPGVLQSEYDIFRDTMEPSMLDKIDAVRPQWPLEAWDRDDIVRLPNGEPARGWKVALKSDPAKPVVGCAHLCEAQAPRYVRERVAKSLAEHPYAARFLDVTGTSVGECYNPKHPLNRRQSEVARRDTFKILGQEFNLLCGAEDGLECYVPHCDYFEGNFSAPFYRVDGGRYMWKTYEKSPEIMARAIDPTMRTPFFEMVFHDCIASYWYWTDYNNRFEDAWWQRDLLNAVSGTPPMYLFTHAVFERQKERLAASVKITTPVARNTANAPMTDWRWLSADRLVQQSRFANGVVSTVNFSDSPRHLPDGRTIPARGFLYDPPVRQ